MILERIDLRDRVRVFRDRTHAGEVLASMLETYRGTDAVALGIPAGGLPVATTVASLLKIPLEIAAVSKIPLPWNTEVGYGAVAFDGTICLNQELIAGIGLTNEELQDGIERTLSRVRRRAKILRGDRPFPQFSRRPAILIDDGLASGFTMHAAIKALQRLGADRIIVAVPTGNELVLHKIAAETEILCCANVRGGANFAVADAYELWSDLSEEELSGTVSQALGERSSMAEKRWEHFDHQADVGVRGIGCSKGEAFEQAAIALTAVITDPISVAAKEPLEVTCEARDDELLLVNWLNALIYEMATRRMLFGRFEVDIDGTQLRAKAWGEAIDPAKHEPAVEVKGATCTSLAVRQDNQGAWLAQCVVDV